MRSGQQLSTSSRSEEDEGTNPAHEIDRLKPPLLRPVGEPASIVLERKEKEGESISERNEKKGDHNDERAKREEVELTTVKVLSFLWTLSLRSL